MKNDISEWYSALLRKNHPYPYQFVSYFLEMFIVKVHNKIDFRMKT